MTNRTDTETPYRPDADETSYPDIYGHAGSSRIYFYDLDTRKELSDHPLNGMGATGEGAMVCVRGQFVDGSADCVFGNAWLGGKMRRVFVDADSFPGRRVAAKVWHASECGWRFLAKGDGTQCDGRGPRLPASTLSHTARA